MRIGIGRDAVDAFQELVTPREDAAKEVLDATDD